MFCVQGAGHVISLNFAKQVSRDIVCAFKAAINARLLMLGPKVVLFEVKLAKEGKTAPALSASGVATLPVSGGEDKISLR